MQIDCDGAMVRWPGGAAACAVGRSGLVPLAAKREGDGATPLGTFALRRVLYRPDRVNAPVTGLSVTALKPEDGWCDDPADASYNRPVSHPYRASAERMWREDGLYDVVVVLGHNDDPVVPGAGSAIFLHCSRHDAGGHLKPTEGCVAIDRAHLLDLLRRCTPGSGLVIRQDGHGQGDL